MPAHGVGAVARPGRSAHFCFPDGDTASGLVTTHSGLWWSWTPARGCASSLFRTCCATGVCQPPQDGGGGHSITSESAWALLKSYLKHSLCRRDFKRPTQLCVALDSLSSLWLCCEISGISTLFWPVLEKLDFWASGGLPDRPSLSPPSLFQPSLSLRGRVLPDRRCRDNGGAVFTALTDHWKKPCFFVV